jgi:hypoxanthine phosphoribosyltransferase
MASEIKHLRVTYNDIHNLIRSATPRIAREFNPDSLIAIGGG